MSGRERRPEAWLFAALLVTPVIAGAVVVSILDGDGVGDWQDMVAWITVSTILATIWYVRTYLRYRATSEEEKRQLRELRPQLLAGTSVMVRIREGFDEADVLERLREGFDRDDELEEDDATVRDVARGLAAAAANARPAWVPVLAWRGILEGGLLLVVGLVAWAPLAYWRAAVATPLVSGDGAVHAVSWGLSAGAAGLAMFPYADVVLGLVLATGVLGIRGVWGSWLLPALVLVAGGVALAVLHRRIGRWESVPDDARIGRTRTRASLRLLAWFVLLWTVGVSISTVVALVDVVELSILNLLPRVEGFVNTSIAGFAEPLGLLAAVGLAVVGLGLWIGRTVGRIRAIGETHAAGTTAIVALLVLRRVYLGISLVGAGLIVGYLGHAVVSGRIFEVVGILSSAPTWVLALLGLGVLSLVVIATLQIPGVLEDLRDLASRVSRSTALRLWVFARGLPVVGTVATFGLVAAMTASFIYAGGAAVVAGTVLRVAGGLIVRAKYRALSRYSGRDRPVAEVHVAPFRVEDADGGTAWVADVDGRRLAHRDREALLEDVVELVRERTETGWSPTTESEHYYDRLEDGKVDLERLRTNLRSRTRLRARLYVRDAGNEVDETAAREALAETFPEEYVDEQIVELRRRGLLDRRNGKLVLRGEDTYGSAGRLSIDV